MQLIKIISSSAIPIRNEPYETSTKISEALFGEKFEILKVNRFWSFGKLINDNYLGWLPNSELSENITNTHKVCVPSTVLKEKPEIKSLDVKVVFLGSELKILSSDNGWAKVLLPSSGSTRHAYIYKKHLQKLSDKLNNWVQLSEKFVGTPYVWGGRSYKGLDCSGLVQICLQIAGIHCPRDSILQYNYFKDQKINSNEIKRGMLIFWDGHVAITTSKTSILHSSSFHMSTIVETIEKVNNRFKKNNIKFLGIRCPNFLINDVN